MRKFFWSVIALILVLVLISLALYSGEETTVAEPLPENISQMIGDLRAAVDNMEADFNNMHEIAAIARAAGKTQKAGNWFRDAKDIQSAILNTFNVTVLSLKKRLDTGELPEAAQKQVAEFMTRAYSLVSYDSRRDMLVVQNAIGPAVSSDDWLALANLYRKTDDTFDRNMGLKALGETLENINRSLAERVYGMIDAPFVKALHAAERASPPVDAGALTASLDDPFLIMQVLVTCGKRDLNSGVIHALTRLLDTVDDPIEKGFFASQILKQLPGIPENDRAPFFAAVENVDDLLMAETKLALIENGAASGAAREKYLSDIETRAGSIPENYPRELIRSRLIRLESDLPPEDIFAMLEEIESVTLRDQTLVYVATHKTACPDSDFVKLIDAMSDSYSRLAAKLDRFKKMNVSREEASQYLESLEGYAEGIKQAQPLVELTAAWGTVDPFRARQSLNRLDTKSKVDAAVALAGIIHDTAALSVILDDVYTELQRSQQFEPVEKSQLMRKLFVPMQQVMPQKAAALLDEAYRLVMEQ